MSRIGRRPIKIPSGVTVTVAERTIVIKGAKGELVAPLSQGITVVQEDGAVVVGRKNDTKQTRAFHGLVRNLIKNHVLGVTEGYKKTLKLVGTGYRVAAKGVNLSLSVGYSHPVEITARPGVALKTEGTDTIHVEGIDKQAVGQMAADIRAVRPPEPYKGKGIRYVDEVVRRKQGKAAA